MILDYSNTSKAESDKLDDNYIAIQRSKWANDQRDLWCGCDEIDSLKSLEKKNNIELFRTCINRESTSSISVKIQIIRFASATLDMTLVLGPMINKENIV